VSHPRHPRWPSLALATAVVVLDQLSKHWANTHLPEGRSLPFLPGLLALQLVHNSGAAFSLFHGASQPLGVISMVVSAAVLLWILRAPTGGIWLRLGLGFLLGGAIGNGLDRWRQGVVTDFLALLPVSFPVFNLADVAINLAVACLLLDQLPMLRGRSSGADGRPRVLGPHAPEPRD